MREPPAMSSGVATQRQEIDPSRGKEDAGLVTSGLETSQKYYIC